MEALKVGLLGAGIVGTQVARIVLEEAEDLEARIGRPLELVGIGVRDLDKERPGIDPALLTTDLERVVDGCDVLIEVMGGLEPASRLIRRALDRGASVVTANKALLAEELAELSALAEAKRADLYYEAAVAGAIPIIRPLRESLVGDEVTTVMGIVNGTTNYILDKMVTAGLSFDDALRQAQELGYAEADPTADVEGHDAAAKAALLAGLAFHTNVKGSEVYCEGISGITAQDIEAAKSMNCTVKLLAVAKGTEDAVTVKVHPAMVPLTHPLASVSGAYNAVFVNTREAGELMFLGPGAGGAPTASAVMGDVVTVARHIVRGGTAPSSSSYRDRKISPIGESRTRYFISFAVEDRPGVLAKCAALFAQHNVSVQTVQQSYLEGLERSDGFSARLGFMTHEAVEDDLAAVVADLRSADFVGDEVRFMRIEGSR
ncbi:homoserine dehydrogenase [Tessaracoccus sp. OH4464_COT-324]|uniref:homoserine dehydrogenase n=1 Tax=Tessaracoccus sp. OH4464_COT-324 TaxID=2491059 RepID=UPI000F63F535|nr:homoserine dehydrogenase [Tessaracoccus sp. OH4464_COT-324]RRD47876.1 homoserine dehydrogenase [Tessaracoccus sp. OH4464_COT-324]